VITHKFIKPLGAYKMSSPTFHEFIAQLCLVRCHLDYTFQRIHNLRFEQIAQLVTLYDANNHRCYEFRDEKNMFQSLLSEYNAARKKYEFVEKLLPTVDRTNYIEKLGQCLHLGKSFEDMLERHQKELIKQKFQALSPSERLVNALNVKDLT